jgi:pseudouridylate synthase / pseudouridine kinase
VPKSTKIFLPPVQLEVFPKHQINIITPNMYELKAMFNAAQENYLFEDKQWWSVLDSFNITSKYREGAFHIVIEIC